MMSAQDIDHGVYTLALFPDPGAPAVMTSARLEALARELDLLERRGDVRLVLLRGGTRAFCLGAELSFIAAASRSDLHAYLDRGRNFCARLASLPVPTIAAVGGLALGGGFELALACDLCWADRRAAFGFPEGDAGLVPAWGGVERVLARLHQSLGWELLLGRRVGSAAAETCGLVSRVFESRGFFEAAAAQARELAALDPRVLRALKNSAISARSGQGDNAILQCLSLQAECETP